MKYKAEVLSNGKPVKQFIKNGVSHPNQVIHSLCNYVSQPMFIAIANENGDRWLYIIEVNRVQGNGYSPRILRKERGHFNRDEIQLVMHNQRPIYRGNEI